MMTLDTLRGNTTWLIAAVVLAVLPQLVAAQAVRTVPKAILLHQVQPGETLDSILQTTYLPGDRPSRGEVVMANPHAFTGGDYRRIIPGTTLSLPLADEPPSYVLDAPPEPLPPRTPVIGTVEMLEGALTALYSGGNRTLQRGQAVHEEDRLLLASGRAKVRLLDGSQLYLQDNTDVLLSRLEFKRGDGNVGHRLIELSRGGLRMISGLLKPEVTAAHPDISTPVAVLGLRGTETVLHYCAAASCPTSLGVLPGGLLTGLADGAVVLGNAAGQAALDPGDVFKVADANSAPQPAPEYRCALLGLDCHAPPPQSGADEPRCKAPRQRGGQSQRRPECR